MGLAGRKVKQRIPNDPRNLSWADDASKFGASYLAKMGWSSGSGLGAAGEGRTTHIKVHQKLDMLGIGHAHQNNPNGIAWKQNNDFENLLRRLNAGNEESAEESLTQVEGFTKAKSGEEDIEDGAMQESKKRKRDEDSPMEEKGEDGGTKAEKRKKKKDKKKGRESGDAKAEKSKRKAEDEEQSPTSSADPAPVRVVAPLRAHRARFLASKRLASKSSAAIDEILGISRSGTATPYPSTSIPATPFDTSSTSTPSAESDDLKLQELTTSSKSVMDYFREKLAAKSNSSASSATHSPAPKASTSPDADDDDDYDERPRGRLGLGASRGGLGAGLSFAPSSSTLRSEIAFTEVEETERRGIGSSSHLSAMFTAVATVTSSSNNVTEEIDEVQTETVEVEEVTERKHKKKKEKRDKSRKSEEEAVAADDSSKKKSKRRKEKERAETDDLDAVKSDEDASHEKSRKKRKKNKDEVALDKEEKKREKKREVASDGDAEVQRKKKKRESKHERITTDS